MMGMSGGVDSSVGAALLKEQGANVVGLFMNNWQGDGCSSKEDFKDVESVCRQLDIPYYEINFAKEYRERVFLEFLDDFKQGITPNPDIMCNREIKFGLFFDKAMALGGDYLATGHYCRKEERENSCRLLKGIDQGKDQSYFLYTIKEEVLKKTLFPVGHLQKREVRRMAARYNLSTARKKDSTGICFIGKRNFKDFLSSYIEKNPGPFKTLSGETVGEHSGYAYYTLGQRKGLGLGGPGEAWFVVGKDKDSNTVFVERGHHSALYASELWARGLEGPQRFPHRCWAKIRYRQHDQGCSLTALQDGRTHVLFDHPQRAVTPGQSIVFYGEGGVCLGGGIIERVGTPKPLL